MPYVLSGIIHEKLPGLWGEGNPYSAEIICDIKSKDPGKPPVNALSHTLKPHSLTHIDAASHIVRGGRDVEGYFSPDNFNCFFGPVLHVKLRGAKWKAQNEAPNLHIWRVTAEELATEIKRVSGKASLPDKVIITSENQPLNQFGYHDPNYVLVLEPKAAELLISNPRFNAFGTSWKSSDFEPGSRERPIHKILLSKAVLYEYLVTWHVPEGEYYLVGFPLLIRGASEAPVTPVLFEKNELLHD